MRELLANVAFKGGLYCLAINYAPVGAERLQLCIYESHWSPPTAASFCAPIFIMQDFSLDGVHHYSVRASLQESASPSYIGMHGLQSHILYGFDIREGRDGTGFLLAFHAMLRLIQHEDARSSLTILVELLSTFRVGRAQCAKYVEGPWRLSAGS